MIGGRLMMALLDAHTTNTCHRNAPIHLSKAAYLRNHPFPSERPLHLSGPKEGLEPTAPGTTSEWYVSVYKFAHFGNFFVVEVQFSGQSHPLWAVEGRTSDLLRVKQALYH